MKKSLLTIVLGLLISVSTIAQSKDEARATKMTNQTIEKIEETLKLTETEKTTFFEIKKVQLLNHFTAAKNFRESNPAKFKEEVQANNKDYNAKVFKAFGRKRAIEIRDAMSGKTK